MRRRNGITTANVLMALAAGLTIAAGLAAIAFGVWRLRRSHAPAAGAGGPAPLHTIDPKLFVCRETAPAFATGFAASRCITMGPDGRVYVSGDRAVRVFDPTGRRVGEMATAGRPGALAVDRDGSLYVAMGEPQAERWDHVEVLAPDGTVRAKWPTAGPKAFLTSLAVTDEDVFVADAGGRIILRYDKSGNLVRRIAGKDKANGIDGLVLRSPYCDVAVAPDGLLRVANTGRYRIETYTRDGEYGLGWGRYGADIEGFCGCCNPASFALLPGEKGGALGGFVTAEKGQTRVKIYDAEGRFAGVLGGPRQFSKHDAMGSREPVGTPFRALDIAVAGDGLIFILDPYPNEVRTFRRTAKSPPAPETRP